MKYKLINITTKQETLCDKITIDGFDYYVSDKEEQVVLGKNYYEHDNHIPIYSFTKDTLPKEYYLPEVIATNKPNIDIPKVENEVEELAYNHYKSNQHYTTRDAHHFGIGYNKSQETYRFSKKDMVDFWNESHKIIMTQSSKSFTPEKLFQIWQEQQPKKVYYNE